MPEEQLPSPQQPSSQQPRPPLPGPRTPVVCACPDCGEVRVPPPQVRVVVCAQEPARSRYQFTCPRCRAVVSRPAGERVVLGLSARGAVVDPLPLEVLEHPDGPALTVDDLLDLLLALQGRDVVDAARGDAPAEEAPR